MYIDYERIREELKQAINQEGVKSDLILLEITKDTDDYGIEEFISKVEYEFVGVVTNYTKFAKRYDSQGKYSNSNLIIVSYNDLPFNTDNIIIYEDNRYRIINSTKIMLSEQLLGWRIFVEKELEDYDISDS